MTDNDTRLAGMPTGRSDERYFTVDIADHVGFTDQINQFFILYHVGRLLGRHYVPTPFENRRSDRVLWQEFAVADAFANKVGIGEPHTQVALTLDIPGSFVLEADIRNLDDYLARLCTELGEAGRGARLIVLKLGAHRNRAMALLASLPSSHFDHFRERLKTALNASGWESPFSSDAKAKLLVHLRKGDTAQISVPGMQDLVVWHQKAALTSKRSVDELHVMRGLTRFLQEKFAGSGLEIAVFSDGYQRTRQVLRHALREHPGYDTDRLDLLDFILDEQEASLRLFSDIPGTRCFVGESGDSFRQLVAGMIDCNLVLSNDSQRMAAKLIGAFPTRLGSKALAVLGRPSGTFGFHLDCLVSESHCRFIPLPWKTFSVAPLVEFLEDCLRGTPGPDLAANLVADEAKHPGRYNMCDWKNLGRRLQDSGRWKDACSAFERYAKLSGNCVDSMRCLALVHRQLGHFEIAEELTQIANRVDEKDAMLSEYHSQIQANMGRAPIDPCISPADED